MTTGRLTGKVAVVTGASSGIGAATAARFAREGARVALLARRNDEGERVAATCRGAAGDAVFIRCDVTDKASVDAAAATVTARWGPAIHVLFNNAGGALLTPPFPNEGLDAWNHVLALNLTGTMLMTQAVWPALCAADGASVVNMSSYAAVGGVSPAQRQRLPGTPQAAYAASKAGIEALTRYTASVGARFKIRANAVRPGQILSPATEVGAGSHIFDAYFADVQLIAGPGTGDDVAATALFLASDESAFITAQIIDIDGGAAGKV
jgi:NAD(P)-dependent dehydrogenase (short-subunit alcohol dehydrogenase family)